ncbi:unnamed protein product [Ectocarpus sp. CCAP 1310/34]|nr:unnamed protein product [Ectocarpus sp. CCAP 1310/34]
MAQVGSIVANMHEAVETAKSRAQRLEDEVAQLKKEIKQSQENDNAEVYTVHSAAMLLGRATADYAQEGNRLVFAQKAGSAPLSLTDPIVEWKSDVPRLLATFLNELGPRSKAAEEGNEEIENAVASRKCLIAAIVTSFAFDTWYKNANAMTIFLKSRGIQRDWLDFLARTFKIAQTDSYVYKVQKKLADSLGTKEEMLKRVPLSEGLVACSFDNLNLDVLRHWGKGGHVDLIAAIAYFAVSQSRQKVTSLRSERRKLGFRRDFGQDHPRILGIWESFRLNVVSCARKPYTKTDGDFEMRLAKVIIHDAPRKSMLGVGIRRPTLFCTRRKPNTLRSLRGWCRGSVIGWHLLEHTLDVLYRKWGGFAMIPLAKASDCHDKKLESKNYHKRHNVFVGVVEAVWQACISEVNVQQDTALSGEDLLDNLLAYTTDRGKHKTHGQWMNDAEVEFTRETFSLSLAGIPGKNTGLDEIQEMTMNKEFKQAATGTDIAYLQRLCLTLQLFARCAEDFKLAFGSSIVYNRTIKASEHRIVQVSKMFQSVTAEGSPFRLCDDKGASEIISAGGRVALERLEETMLDAPEPWSTVGRME